MVVKIKRLVIFSCILCVCFASIFFGIAVLKSTITKASIITICCLSALVSFCIVLCSYFYKRFQTVPKQYFLSVFGICFSISVGTVSILISKFILLEDIQLTNFIITYGIWIFGGLVWSSIFIYSKKKHLKKNNTMKRLKFAIVFGSLFWGCITITLFLLYKIFIFKQNIDLKDAVFYCSMGMILGFVFGILMHILKEHVERKQNSNESPHEV